MDSLANFTGAPTDLRGPEIPSRSFVRCCCENYSCDASGGRKLKLPVTVYCSPVNGTRMVLLGL